VATTISQRELRNDNAEIMRRIEAGETFVVTRRGIAVADLVPHVADAPAGPQRYVSAASLIESAKNLPRIDVAHWYRDRAELDALLDDDDVDPWLPR